MAQAERGLVERVGLPDAADPLRGVHRLLVQPSLRAMAMLRKLTKRQQGEVEEARAGSERNGLVRGGEEGAFYVMHGRSRMTIEPRIPTMPGRKTSGFHRPGRHRLRFGFAGTATGTLTLTAPCEG